MKDTLNNNFDCIVIGGGYAGCVLALACANFGVNVCIIEKNDIIARKILSTGNGRCNFTNADIDSSKFFTSTRNFDFNQIDYKKSIDFIRNLGVIEKEINGYYYPVTNQAKTIRDAIDSQIRTHKIHVVLNTQVKSIEKQNNTFLVKGINVAFSSKYVVVATGGLAAPKLGTNGDGFYLASKLGIKTIPTVPGLVGLSSTDEKLRNIAGIRCQGKVIFNDHSFEGEVQFNKDSISGYPVMCLSRFIAYDLINKSESQVTIDLIPFMSFEELKEYINKFTSQTPYRTILELLSGILNDKILTSLLDNKLLNKKLIDINNDILDTLATKLKTCKFKIHGTKGYEYAQTTAGGISLDELDSTFMSVKYPGLYFIGEVLDVDGICGGYNLEWARFSATKAAEGIINDSNRSGKS